jgi:hypothetical protein
MASSINSKMDAIGKICPKTFPPFVPFIRHYKSTASYGVGLMHEAGEVVEVGHARTVRSCPGALAAPGGRPHVYRSDLPVQYASREPGSRAHAETPMTRRRVGAARRASTCARRNSRAVAQRVRRRRRRAPARSFDPAERHQPPLELAERGPHRATRATLVRIERSDCHEDRAAARASGLAYVLVSANRVPALDLRHRRLALRAGRPAAAGARPPPRRVLHW